jgi:hypothetical protein
MLQLNHLRTQCKKPWSSLEKFFPRVVGDDMLLRLVDFNLQLMIGMVQSQWSKLPMDEKAELFLNEDMEKVHLMRGVGERLAQRGVTRRHLLDLSMLQELGSLLEKPDNGIIVELNRFKVKEKLTLAWFRKVLESTGLCVSNLSNRMITLYLKKINGEYTSKQKSVDKEIRRQRLEVFLSTLANIDQLDAVRSSTNANFCNPDIRKMSNMSNMNASLRRQLEETTKQLEMEKSISQVLRDIIKEKNQRIADLVASARAEKTTCN